MFVTAQATLDAESLPARIAVMTLIVGLPSLAVHHSDRSISSAFFLLLIASSNATLRALSDAIRRGSRWALEVEVEGAQRGLLFLRIK